MSEKVEGVQQKVDTNHRVLKDRIEEVDWKMQELQSKALKEFEDYRRQETRVN